MTDPHAISGIHARHQAELDRGRFLIQRCGACHQHVYFPREICPHCGSQNLAFVAPQGLGTVYAVTTVRRKADAGGDYNVSLIDLDEGVRLMSRIDNLAPGEVKIDQRVMARVQLIEGRGVVMFDAVQGGAA
ncbi:MAG: OB-fold domain-containing protein [Rhodoferax sp.]|nr:OB-fold domain-containing protein [Rhodoferax sp.]